MTDITALTKLRIELSSPAIGSKDHLRKISLSLIDELEKAQKLATQQGNIACALFDEVTAQRQRIAGLESRTVIVKLAEDRSAESEIPGYDGTEFYRAGWNARGKADRDVLAAAGIQVIEGEGQ